MKKIVIGALTFVAVIILAIAYFIIFVYFKPHVDYCKAEHDVEIGGEQLYNAFVNDDIDALRTYNGKVLLVHGVVDALETPEEDLQIAVMFFYEDEFWGNEGVRFSLLEGEAEHIAVGSEMWLKGLCTGFTGHDVIIEHVCVVSEQPEKHVNRQVEKPPKINGTIVVDSKRLFTDFVNNHRAAIHIYKDNKVLVNGVVNSLENFNNKQIAYMVIADGLHGPEGVRFFLADGQAARVNINSELWLEGYCIGYTGFDVVIEYASVTEKPGL